MPSRSTFMDQDRIRKMATHVPSVMSLFFTQAVRNRLATNCPDPRSEFQVKTYRESWCENAPASPYKPIGTLHCQSWLSSRGCLVKKVDLSIIIQNALQPPRGAKHCRNAKRALRAQGKWEAQARPGSEVGANSGSEERARSGEGQHATRE